MGKCGIAKILFYAYSLILLVGYALFAVVNYYPPAQSVVLKEGARVKLSYVALQNSQPPLITIERESGQAKLYAASVEPSPDDITYQVYTPQSTSKSAAHARRRIDIRCLECADTPIGLNHIEVEILSLRPEIRGETARVYLASRTWLDSAFRTPLNRDWTGSIYGWISLLALFPVWLGVWLIWAVLLYRQRHRRLPKS